MALTTVGGRFATNGSSRFGPSSDLVRLNQLNLNMELATAANPWLAEDPLALLRIAQSGADPFTIADNSAALAGLESIDTMAASLSRLNPVAQRSVYGKLTEAQQRALNQIGFQPSQDAGAGGDGGWFGDVMGAAGTVTGIALQPLKYTAVPVVKGGMDALTWVGDVPGHFYRAIRQMDDWQQWVALGAAGLTIGALAASGPLGWGAGAAYLSGAAGFGTFGTLGAFGAAGLGAGVLATAPSAITNPTEWWDVMNPFGKNGIGRGETVFTQGAQSRAKEILGHAGHLDALARDIAAEMDPYDIAEEFAGVRDANSQDVMMSSVKRVADKLADDGTPEHQAIYKGLMTLIEQPEFRQAVDTLQAGKISFGRDLANTVGLEPGDTGYSLVSGSIDAAWLFAMDPLMMMGKIGQVKNLARRGLDRGSATEAVQRITQMINEDPAVAATVRQVAKAVDTGSFTDMPKEWRSMYLPLREHVTKLRVQGKAPQVFDEQAFAEYIEGGEFLRRLMEGKATVRGSEKIVVSARNSDRGWSKFVEEARQFNRGLSDTVLEDDLRRAAKKFGTEAELEKMLPSFYADRAIDMKFEYRALDALPINETAGYAAGRRFGNGLLYVPGGRSFGNFMAGITTMIPQGHEIKLVQASADDIRDVAEDVPRFVDAMGIHFNMPSYIRDEWVNTIMANPNVAMRRNALISFMDSIFEATGFRSLDTFNAQADEFLLKYKQAYALGGADVAQTFYGTRTLGVLPDAHGAVYMVMPDIKEMTRLYRQGHILKNIARITDSDFAEQSMSRVIKPGWLLRIGFIPRAAGEEMLAFWVRASEGGIIQEANARRVAKRDKALEALSKLRREGTKDALSPEELKALAEWRVPGHMQPLVWANRRQGWRDTDRLWTDRYLRWSNELRRNGVFGFEEAGKHLPDWGAAIVYGKEHSYRRMLAEGVDADLLEAARLWTGIHSTQIMRATGAHGASNWERDLISPENTMPRTDPNNPSRGRDVNIRMNGEYERVGPGDLRYDAGVHHRAGEWSHDQIVAPIIAKAITEGQFGDLQNIDKVKIYEALEAVRVMDGQQSMRLAGELLQFRADNALEAARGYDEHFPRMAEIIRDTVRRGEFTPAGLRTGIQRQKDVILYEEAKRVAEHNAEVARTRRGKMWTEREPAKIPEWNQLDRIDARIEHFTPTLEWLDTLGDSEKAWVSSILTRQMASNHTAFDTRRLNRWAKGTVQERPKRIYYRGVPDNETAQVLPDGSLLLKPQPQNHWTAYGTQKSDVYAVSMSIDPHQSMGYQSKRGGGGRFGHQVTEDQYNVGAMIELDADYMDGRYNTSWDEIVMNPASYINPEYRGDGLYLMGLPQNEEVRPFTEVSLATATPDGIIIPPGKWRIQNRDDMEKLVEAAKTTPVEQRGAYDFYSAKIKTHIGDQSMEDLMPSLNTTIDDWINSLSPEDQLTLGSQLDETFAANQQIWTSPDYWSMDAKIEKESTVFADLLDGIDLADVQHDAPVHALATRIQELLDTKVSGEVTVAEVLRNLKDDTPLGQFHLDDVFRERMGRGPAAPKHPSHIGNGLETSDGGLFNLMIRGGFELRGQGAWETVDDLDQWSPFVTDFNRWREQLISDIAAELAKPQHTDKVKIAEQPLHLSGGAPVARPPADGITRIYTPVVAPDNDGLNRLLDQLNTGNPALDSALRPAWTKLNQAITDRNPRLLNEAMGDVLQLNQGELGRWDTEIEQLLDVYYDHKQTIEKIEMNNPAEWAEILKDDDKFAAMVEPLYVALDQLNVRTYEGVARQVLAATRNHHWTPTMFAEWSDDEKVALLSRAIRYYDANRGRYGIKTSQALDGVAFDDPRIAKWISTMLADNDASALHVGVMEVPRGALSSSGTELSGVRLAAEREGSRAWDLDARYLGRATPMEAPAFQHVPYDYIDETGRRMKGIDVIPGASWEKSLHDWAERIVDAQLLNMRRGVTERQVFKGGADAQSQVARRVGSEYKNLEPGEVMDKPEDLFLVKNGKVTDPVKFGDDRYFRHEVTEMADELMMPIIGPYVRDHYEEAAGLHTYGPASFIERRGRFGKSKPVHTDEQLSAGEVRRFTRARIEDVQLEPAKPSVGLVQGYDVVNDTIWDRIVRYGFDNVIGPALDTLARQPMSFHYFASAYKQNRNYYTWMLNRELFADFDAEWAPMLKILDDESAALGDHFERAHRLVREVNGDYIADKIKTPEDLIRYIQGVENLEPGGWDNMVTVGVARMKGNAEAELWRLNAPQDYIFELPDYRYAVDELPALREIKPHALTINLPGEGVGAETTGERLVRAYHEAVPDEVWGEGHDAVVKFLRDKVPQLPSEFTPKQWRLLKDARNNMAHVLDTAKETATLRAMENVIPFLDSHEQRSLFSEYGRNWLPFWYAEENFLKRWVRTASLGRVGLPGLSGTLPSLGLDQLRKMQLTYMGIKSAGAIRTDANGNDWVVYPGSGLLMEAVAKILPGDVQPIGVTFAANTNSILPGISDNNNIGVTPFITTPATFLLELFPESQGVKDALRGPVGSTKSIQSQFIPSSLERVWSAVFSDETSSVRYNSAMNAAIAYAEAQGRGLPDNATAEQREEYLDMIRNHARIILVSQALVGFVAPGAPVAQVSGGTGDPLTHFGWEDPKEYLSEQYRELITEFGIEDGTAEFLRLNPQGTIENIVRPLALTAGGSTSASRAPLPATRLGITWYNRNKDWVDTLPEAGAWFMPQDGDTEFEYRAYQDQVANGLRQRRTPQEFLTAIKYRTAADEYFRMKDGYDEIVAQLGGDRDRKAQLDAAYDMWKSTYLAAHPIFAEELQSGDSRIRRDRQIEQLRYAVRDPKKPDSPYTDAIAEMVKTYDDFTTVAKMLRARNDSEARRKLKVLKSAFEDWGNQWADRNEPVKRLWTSVYRIEAGI